MSKGTFDQGLFLMRLQKGKEYFDQDQLDQAREELEAAYELRPQDEKVLNMLGMTYYKLEMLPQAEEMYIRLANSNQEVYALQSNLGLIQLKLNKLAEARDALNRALELQPNNSKAHFYMGLLYEKKELWEEALYHFEQANAEKMVAKVKMKLEELQDQQEILSPFEVIEVIETPDAGYVDEDFAKVIESEMHSEPQQDSSSEITGRMRTHDLAEAMFQVHHSDEILRPEDILQSTDESSEESPETARLRLEQLVSQQPEEELIEDESQSQEASEINIEEAGWTKTEPGFFPESFEEPSPLIHQEANVVIPSAVDEPFFLSDDIAADISTFLAQSRPEHAAEEDVFYQDSGSPELAVIRSPELEETQEHIPPPEEEYRIPTPEEVENEVGIPEMKQEPEMQINVEEEFIRIPAEFLIPAASNEPVEELDAEEDLEVNFAVSESEEEETSVEEGFLQPSPLTPEGSEEILEQTQDMDSVVPELAQSVSEIAGILREHKEETEPVTEPEAIVTQDPEPVVTEPEPVVIEPEPVVIDEPEPPVAEKPEPEPEHTMSEEEASANLDQFSRDRLHIQPIIGSDRFLLIDPHLLEIIISDRLICRIGTISSYTGNLHFTPVEESKGKVPLIEVSGTGILFLADRRKEIFLISLNNEALYVETNHLLVAQSSLKVEPQTFHQKEKGASFSIARISGRGTLALTCLTKPLTVNVNEELPANIPAQAVIAWSGKLVSEVMDDAELRKIMMNSDSEAMFLRFRGAGDVVVEQGGLWGDRRTRR
jgi:tetratricopeptide (TPR) repeat protein